VLDNEPDTITYLVHLPLSANNNLKSLPVTSDQEVTFYEAYKSEEAFKAHVTGSIFKEFVQKHGYLFEQSEENSAKDKPFHTVSFLQCVTASNRYISFVDYTLNFSPVPRSTLFIDSDNMDYHAAYDHYTIAVETRDRMAWVI